MPVYTLNPSHRRGARKASRSTSLRERIAARRNPLSEDGAVVSNPRRRTGMYSVEAIHDGTAWAITDATATDVKVGFAMSYDEARRLVERHAAEARAKGHRLMWYDMSTHNETKKRNPLSEDGAVVSNPRRGGGRAAQKAGLKKGQSLMSRAAAAYRAGEYASMQDALRGVSDGGRKHNPLSEDGAVVSNPRSAKGSRYVNVTLSTAKGQTIREARYDHPWFGTYKLDEIALEEARNAPIGSIITIRDGRLEDRYKVVDVPHISGKLRGIQKMRRRNPLSEDGAVVSNPRRKGGKGKAKRSGGRTAAQSNAAKAMKLFHSGQASSLGEAWEMVRGGR